ncbi:Glycerol-1-phosphate phosphohydrolase 2 [Leucoagaricus sp. SymC.cos]|nr:Glycerol-1-phosphate phosphohydrolase 2 [Leucoagaricus sp. SymC.cos]
MPTFFIYSRPTDFYPRFLQASNKYAPRALKKAGVTAPQVGLITANDVVHGKPHPTPYLAGATKCGVEANKCLVVEDAISGLRSGKAAGAKTLAVCTSTEHSILKEKGVPDYIVKDLTCVTVEQLSDGQLKININVD